MTKLSHLNRVIEEPKPRYSQIAFTGDARTLLAGNEDGLMRRIDVGTGKDLVSPQQWHGETRLVTAADGRHVFALNPNGTVYVLRLGEAGSRKAGS